MTTAEIEIAIAQHYNLRENLILPNAFWGLGFRHEIDLLVVNKKSKYATEIEIKISKSDLKRDQLKKAGHASNIIRRFYFAIPETIPIDFALENIPERAGLFVIRKIGDDYLVEKIKNAKINTLAKPISDKIYIKALELAAIRIWNLKRKLIENFQKKCQ